MRVLKYMCGLIALMVIPTQLQSETTVSVTSQFDGDIPVEYAPLSSIYVINEGKVIQQTGTIIFEVKSSDNSHVHNLCFDFGVHVNGELYAPVLIARAEKSNGPVAVNYEYLIYTTKDYNNDYFREDICIGVTNLDAVFLLPRGPYTQIKSVYFKNRDDFTVDNYNTSLSTSESLSQLAASLDVKYANQYGGLNGRRGVFQGVELQKKFVISNSSRVLSQPSRPKVEIEPYESCEEKVHFELVDWKKLNGPPNSVFGMVDITHSDIYFAVAVDGCGLHAVTPLVDATKHLYEKVTLYSVKEYFNFAGDSIHDRLDKVEQNELVVSGQIVFVHGSTPIGYQTENQIISEFKDVVAGLGEENIKSRVAYPNPLEVSMFPYSHDRLYKQDPTGYFEGLQIVGNTVYMLSVNDIIEGKDVTVKEATRDWITRIKHHANQESKFSLFLNIQSDFWAKRLRSDDVDCLADEVRILAQEYLSEIHELFTVAYGIDASSILYVPIDEPTTIEEWQCISMISELVSEIHPASSILVTTYELNREWLSMVKGKNVVLQIVTQKIVQRELIGVKQHYNSLWSYQPNFGRRTYSEYSYFKDYVDTTRSREISGIGFWAFANTTGVGSANNEFDGYRPDFSFLYENADGEVLLSLRLFFIRFLSQQ